MSRSSDPPKPIGELIDQFERIREELKVLQGSLEKIETVAAIVGQSRDIGLGEE
jgi:hypothetical protein